jgi:hypothetical protein
MDEVLLALAGLLGLLGLIEIVLAIFIIMISTSKILSIIEFLYILSAEYLLLEKKLCENIGFFAIWHEEKKIGEIVKWMLCWGRDDLR